MARRPALDRPRELCLSLPESSLAKVDALLYSPLEGRVPHGAYRDFFGERISEFFSWRRLDLSPLGYPPGWFIAGPREMIDEIERRMQHQPPTEAQ